jgi:hypothetical protein
MNTHGHNPERDSTAPEPAPAGPPSVAEVAALLRRLRRLTAAGRDADPGERAAFLADKNALLARIPGYDPTTDPDCHNADNQAPDGKPPDTPDVDTPGDQPQHTDGPEAQR